MLDTTLIENALALTGKTIDDISIRKKIYGKGTTWKKEISIEKFSYYILSPEFIEKYTILENSQWEHEDDFSEEDSITMYFGKAIWHYQSGNEKPLIELLSKIGN